MTKQEHQPRRQLTQAISIHPTRPSQPHPVLFWSSAVLPCYALDSPALLLCAPTLLLDCCACSAGSTRGPEGSPRMCTDLQSDFLNFSGCPGCNLPCGWLGLRIRKSLCKQMARNKLFFVSLGYSHLRQMVTPTKERQVAKSISAPVTHVQQIRLSLLEECRNISF